MGLYIGGACAVILCQNPNSKIQHAPSVFQVARQDRWELKKSNCFYCISFRFRRNFGQYYRAVICIFGYGFSG